LAFLTKEVFKISSRWAILSDFDGTIIKDDASQLILSKYAVGNWVMYDEMLAKGETSFEDCIYNQFRLIRTSESTILKDYDRFVSKRDGFDEIVAYAKARDVPFTIVSGGLEFIIREFLVRNGWIGFIKLHAGRVSFIEGGISISFPPLEKEGSISFKDDLVLKLKGEGKRVIYIGDGTYDFRAAIASDITFAVRGSKLAKLGLEGGLNFHEFDDFSQVVGVLAFRLG
jgi:2-hydroxy-3-keto-5-methylthiopentenyl-1-phosphate phosphatase